MRYLSLLFLLLHFNGYSQWKTYIIGVKGDTLNKVDLKGQKQGRWVTKVDELRGEPGYEDQGSYVNNKREGTWQRFTPMGDILAIEHYRWGNKDGQNVYFNNMGNPIREESWKAVNPDNPYDTVNVYDINDPTKIVSRRVVKLDGFSLKNGTWKFYDQMTGAIEKTEKWSLDKPVQEAEKADDLRPLAVRDNDAEEDTTTTSEKKKTSAKPQAVLDYEKKNSGKKKIRVRDGSTGY